jgi:hypothetical protein
VAGPVPGQGLGQAVQAGGLGLELPLGRRPGGKEHQGLGPGEGPGPVARQQVALPLQHLGDLPGQGRVQPVPPALAPPAEGGRILGGLGPRRWKG